MSFATGLRLGKILGIEVAVDWSLLIIFFLISFSLAMGVFPVWHPDWSMGLSWITALVTATLFFVSVLLHEFSHALVGRLYGVDVQRIILFIFGGMAQIENDPKSWKGEFLMAIAGPITSFALGIFFLWLAGMISGPISIDPEDPLSTFATLGPVTTLLMWLGPVNIILAIFNLIPGFPLDGGRVLRSILWGISGDHLRATRWASAGGQGFAWILMATGVAMILGVYIPFLGTGVIAGFWLVLIGWFLNNAALHSYRQLLTRQSLEDIDVSRLMQTRFTRIDPRMPVTTLLDRHFMASGQRTFPVEQDGRLVGIISLKDLSDLPREDRENARVADVMTQEDKLITVPPNHDAFEALTLMGRHNVNQLPVMDQGRLVGLIHREDALKWLFLYKEGEYAQHPLLSR